MKFYRPNILVLIGVVLTIASAVFTHFVISKQTRAINDYKTQSIKVDQRIDSLWNDVQKIENKLTYVSMLMVINDSDESLIIDLIKDILYSQMKATIGMKS